MYFVSSEDIRYFTRKINFPSFEIFKRLEPATKFYLAQDPSSKFLSITLAESFARGREEKRRERNFREPLLAFRIFLRMTEGGMLALQAVDRINYHDTQMLRDLDRESKEKPNERPRLSPSSSP